MGTLLGIHLLSFLKAGGYWAVFLAMIGESGGLPIASEIVLPFAGYLIAIGDASFWGMTWAAMAGSMLGSYLLFEIGRFGGRPLMNKYGKWVLITHHHLDTADRWFARFGGQAAFWGRLLPVVRTYISLPAGIARMGLWRFLIYSFVGALPWTMLLIWVGEDLGTYWTTIIGWVHRYDLYSMLIALLLLGAYFVKVGLDKKKAKTGN